MREAFTDLWEKWPEEVVVVTTNGSFRHSKKGYHLAVMGSGCAYEATEKIPQLEYLVGSMLNMHGNHVHFFQKRSLITFPTKAEFFQRSSYNLISRSAKELKTILDEYKIKQVHMPRPGCGLEKLTWKNVKELLEQEFKDDDRIIVHHYDVPELAKNKWGTGFVKEGTRNKSEFPRELRF